MRSLIFITHLLAMKHSVQQSNKRILLHIVCIKYDLAGLEFQIPCNHHISLASFFSCCVHFLLLSHFMPPVFSAQSQFYSRRNIPINEHFTTDILSDSNISWCVCAGSREKNINTHRNISDDSSFQLQMKTQKGAVKRVYSVI